MGILVSTYNTRMVSVVFVKLSIIWKIWKISRFIYVHNGSLFIEISLIFGMQTFLLTINSCATFKWNLKIAENHEIVDIRPFWRFSSNLGVQNLISKLFYATV